MDVPDWKKLRATLEHWIAYFGLRRIVITALSLGVSVVVVWLLIRPSAPLIEATLPNVASTNLVVRTTDASGVVIVHVTGAVKKPGVFELSSHARVIDAVTAAGGPTAQADLQRINLAQTIIDTEQIYVPARSSSRPRITVAPRLQPTRTTPPLQTPGAIAPSVTTEVIPTDGRININSATAQQLDALPGVGPLTAKAIVSYRGQKGPFVKIEDLMNVPGIGPAKFAAMKSKVSVS